MIQIEVEQALAPPTGPFPSRPQTAAAASSGTRARQRADVIVIGAGMAGLACARALGKKGKRGLVLEARSRLGGRIHSVAIGGAMVDLGASWLEGSKRNPLQKLVDQAGGRLIRTDYESMELYDLDGRELKGREHRAIDEALERTMAELLRAKRHATRDDSLEPIVRRALEQPGLSATEQRGLRWSLAMEIAGEFACEYRDLSLSQWDEDYAYGGGDYQFAASYSSLVDFLAAECARLGFEIRTGAVVQSIDWSSPEVGVHTAEIDYRSPQVVVTLPLGVLKRGTVEFRDKLPADKQRAIARLGIGNLNKIVMAFRERFWPKDASYFGCLGEASEISPAYWNLEPVTGMPLLAAFFSGDTAVRLEGMSDGEIQTAALGPLRRVFGRRVGEPLTLQVSRWAADPFSRGAYSHVAPSGSYDDYDVLAQPIGNRLFFAGEATNIRYPSTVHGAYESGKRAAQLILG